MDEVVVFVVVVVFTGIKHTHKICGLATLCLNVNILIIGHRYASIFYCRKYTDIFVVFMSAMLMSDQR